MTHIADSATNYRQQYLSQLRKVNGIEIQALPLYQRVPAGIEMEMPVLYRILVGDHSQVVQRKPVHICLVLDRSGSMAGDPLKNCKKAVKQVINQLEPTDRVSFVVYDDSVDVVFTRKSVDDYKTLEGLIDNVQDRGWTNISGGLTKAADILNAYEANESKETYQRLVFLFSDGEANRGITNLDDLGSHMAKWVDKDGLRFSSFGIGVQYNEKWMRSIARGGEGQYFFIDNVENVPNLVDKCLSAFTQVVGEHANIRLRGMNTHLLTSLQNDKSVETLLNGRTAPYLRSLGMYQYLSTIKLRGTRTESECEENVMECDLTFTPVKGLEYSLPLKNKLKLTFVSDLKTDQLEKNPEVVCYLTVGECAELNQKVDDAMKRYNKAEAIKFKKEIIAKYEAVQKYDQYGVIGAMLERDRKALAILEKEGVTESSSKMQNYSCGYAYNVTSCSEKSAWEANKSNDVEEECDMGMALFD